MIAKTKVEIDKIRDFAKKGAEEFIMDFILIFIACLVGGFAIVSIMIPSGLSSGGLTGLSRILQQFIDVNFSTLYYIGAFIILGVCVVVMGMREAKKIMLMSIMYPTVLFMLEKMHFKLLDNSDPLLSAIYCGVCLGICNGIAFYRGYSSGGSDTVAKLIQRKLLMHVSLSKILMAIDAIIIVISGFVFGRNVALYALITTVIASKSTDYVLFGLETKIVQVEIITKEPQTIANYIMKDMYRGVSIEKIIGAYSGETKDKLIVLCSPREGIKLRQYVANIDDKALVTIIHMDGVWGNGAGFNNIDKEA